MRVATWNINGVRARLQNLTAWLAEEKPDVVCLQEIKCQTEAFPASEIESLGYNLAVHGQKGFNGVAILSRRPIEDVSDGLPGDDEDAHARFIEAVIPGETGTVRVASIYLPNGNPIGGEKFAYKLAWLERLRRHAEARLRLEEPMVLAGDYNVIPTDLDAKNPGKWVNDALFQSESRSLFRALVHLGLTDAIRIHHPGQGVYTFWDYTAGAWQKNDGIRIDHLLLSPQATDRMTGAGIDRAVRSWEKPSDHVPAWVDIGA
ncbi:exodeoxyribonuclease III [Lutibaculum baratangense]|uniref:Exodeoxyribonuclease III n=1 Tax=Lutibaculum baratangense AMV1 TaxID=631454 RepID=V4RJV8_9HYPH|nr:exodeoxyribonuclease III [Lutibaculum baratangense]ESR23535.1 Exodeoxyribonuclease III [Lutibaculum baratangense AMV1]